MWFFKNTSKDTADPDLLSPKQTATVQNEMVGFKHTLEKQSAIPTNQFTMGMILTHLLRLSINSNLYN